MSRRRKKKSPVRQTFAGLGIAVLMVAGMVGFRVWQNPAGTDGAGTIPEAQNVAAEQVSAGMADNVQPGAADLPYTEIPTAESSAELPVEEAGSEQTEAADESTGNTARTEAAGIVYRAYDYDGYTMSLVNEMLFAYRNQSLNKEAIISDKLGELKDVDWDLGVMWEKIFAYWDYINQELELNWSGMPGDLPQDDSLCIVVLGYQLNSDGTMADELLGRLNLALEAARQYPNAYIAVTGGGTALCEPEATEAGVMAQWLQEQGIDSKRIIVEDQSLTTYHNALNTGKILVEQYPQITSLAMVTSDYHMRLGCLMFGEEALLLEYETGKQPFRVVAHNCFGTGGSDEFSGTSRQANYVWGVANPEARQALPE